MLTYLIVLAVVVAVLYGSFRALAAGRPVAPADHAELLDRLLALSAERAAELDAALAAAPPAAGADPAVEAAATARKRLGGYVQQLSRLDPAGGARGEQLEAGRALLVAAVEDLGWACRLVEAGIHRDNPGIGAAVAVLREHGGEYLRAAEAVLAAVGEAAEEG